MKFYYTLPSAIIGMSIAFAQPQVATATCNKQVDQIAEKITVLIDSKKPGSGVIINNEGNTYTVLTAYHVVNKPNLKYEIVTPDNQRYQLNYQTVKRLDNNVDLAVLQFTSKKKYQFAKLGNSDEIQRRRNVYVSGFPLKTAGVRLSVYACRNGIVDANATQVSVDNGYNLIYDNPTLPGMSGGAVLNEQGELVGIHASGGEAVDIERDRINPSIAVIKSGRNSGVPINTFIRLSAKVGINLGISLPSTPKVTTPTADDFLVLALDKYQKGDYQGAIVAYNEAVRLNPELQAAIADHYQQSLLTNNSTETYNRQGSIRLQEGDNQGAFADFNQALKINPNDALAYIGRGTARYELGDKKAAIDDFNQAIRINPNNIEAYSTAYALRGITRYELGDKKAAIDDFKQAYKINPNLDPRLQAFISKYYQQPLVNLNPTKTYTGEGMTQLEYGAYQEALANFNQAIKVNPNDTLAYFGRGRARDKLGDKQGAIADYTQAIKLNPKYYKAYIGRGSVRYELGDKQGAIVDLSQSLKINPNSAETYYVRGIMRYELGNKKEGIDDVKKAVNLFQQQGNQQSYQTTLQLLNRLQQ